MKSLFSIDSPIVRFLSTLADLMLLNLLWILCSFPIITIGASTTACYYVCFRMIRGEGTVIRDFFSSFRENFRQSTKLWLIVIVAAGFLYFDFIFLELVNIRGKEILRISLIFIAAICTFTVLYAFPLLAQFENSIKNTIRNALHLSFRYFGKTVIMCLPFVLIADVFIFLPAIALRMLIVWLFFLVSCPVYICCHVLKSVFAIHLKSAT